jgi:plastocyanin
VLDNENMESRERRLVKRFLLIVGMTVGIGTLPWATVAGPPYTQIVIEDSSPYFVPVTATIASGSPIRWENPTPTHHTITHNACVDDSAPCAFDSGTVAPGETYTLPGLPPGRYPYHCRIHPIMRGVLTVTDGSSMPSQL